MLSLWLPTESAEGYQYETVRENYALADNQRSMRISYAHPLAHLEGMLVAYLPDDKILIEADLFDDPGSISILQTETSSPNLASNSLLNPISRLNLDVETIVPIHGQPVSWDTFMATMD